MPMPRSAALAHARLVAHQALATLPGWPASLDDARRVAAVDLAERLTAAALVALGTVTTAQAATPRPAHPPVPRTAPTFRGRRAAAGEHADDITTGAQQ